MSVTKQQLSEMTNQEVNITLADLLGKPWCIRPENNEENNLSWKFSEGDHGLKPYLPNYTAGCKEICDLIVEYELGITPMEAGGWKVAGLPTVHDNPWRAVAEYLILEGVT